MKLRNMTYAVLALFTLGICAAQTSDTAPKEAEGRFFHLAVVVKEVDEGKVLSSRTYSTTLSTLKTGNARVRTGSKIPVSHGSGDFTYIDLGISFDCRFLGEIGNSLRLLVSADISSVAGNSTEPSPGPGPVIRQNKWDSEVLVPIGKPTTIYSSDDLTSKRKMQIELTATPIAP
jgi:hypothetical protein